GAEEEVAVGVFGNSIQRLARVFGQDFVQHLAVAKNLVGLNFDVGDLALHAAVGLVQHDPRVGQGETLAFAAAGEQDRSSAGRLPVAVRADGAREHLHRVVDRQGGGDVTAGRIDVEVHVLAAVFALQVEQ